MIKTGYLGWELQSLARHNLADPEQRWSAYYAAPHGSYDVTTGWGPTPESALADAQRTIKAKQKELAA